MQSKPTSLALRRRFEALKTLGLALDMTRGKPSAEQLALSEPMRTITDTQAGTIDCRNYGGLEGLPEARALCAEYLGVRPEETLVLGNSSLTLMHDVFVQALLRPHPEIKGSWNDLRSLGLKPKMLCPVPGYDRHHAICAHFDIEMLPVPMRDDGPDVRMIVELLKGRPDIIGMWCIPKYSNPTGITYSEKVARVLAYLRADILIFWDLAYAAHDLRETPDEVPNILELCKEAHHEDRVFIFGSTSKITFAGAGISMLAASEKNIAWFKESLAVQTIGPDKLNQLRHVRFLKDMDGVRALMAKHRAIIRPKFETVNEVFRQQLGGRGIAQWSNPRGGYFISLYVQHGCAKRVVTLAAELGVKLTPAGAAFPYGNDPEDSHIRIAPTFPPLAEVRQAAEVVALCVQIAAEE